MNVRLLMQSTVVTFCTALVVTPVFAQRADSSAARRVVRVKTPGGSVVSVDSAQHQVDYNDWHFAPARVEGDWIYISGIPATARASDEVPFDVPALEASFRRAWTDISAVLAAAGSSTVDIVEITSFHVLDSPFFKGTKWDHINAFRRVKDEFVRAPYPAWTGIGAATLFSNRGIVEIRVVARRHAGP